MWTKQPRHLPSFSTRAWSWFLVLVVFSWLGDWGDHQPWEVAAGEGTNNQMLTAVDHKKCTRTFLLRIQHFHEWWIRNPFSDIWHKGSGEGAGRVWHEGALHLGHPRRHRVRGRGRGQPRVRGARHQHRGEWKIWAEGLVTKHVSCFVHCRSMAITGNAR